MAGRACLPKLQIPYELAGRYNPSNHNPSTALMIRDLDIYRSANVLIREHGEDAVLEAVMRADVMVGAEAEPKIGLAICVSAFCP